ncbi:MAG: hypothetical protein ACRDN0_30080 [Trebonia sp.]
MSGTVLWIMCAVIVVSLAIWLAMVAFADRTPYFRHPDIQRRRGGRVMGGVHTGDGRSVMPPRNEPASETGAKEDTPVPDYAGTDRGKTAHGKSGSPLDL